MALPFQDFLLKTEEAPDSQLVLNTAAVTLNSSLESSTEEDDETSELYNSQDRLQQTRHPIPVLTNRKTETEFIKRLKSSKTSPYLNPPMHPNNLWFRSRKNLPVLPNQMGMRNMVPPRPMVPHRQEPVGVGFSFMQPDQIMATPSASQALSSGLEQDDTLPVAVAKCVLCDLSFKSAVKLVVHMNSPAHRVQVQARDSLGLPLTSELSCLAVVPLNSPGTVANQPPPSAYGAPRQENTLEAAAVPAYNNSPLNRLGPPPVQQHGASKVPVHLRLSEPTGVEFAREGVHPHMEMPPEEVMADYRRIPNGEHHHHLRHLSSLSHSDREMDLREVVSGFSSAPPPRRSPSPRQERIMPPDDLPYRPLRRSPSPRRDRPPPPHLAGFRRRRSRSRSPSPPARLPPRQRPGAWREVQRRKLERANKEIDRAVELPPPILPPPTVSNSESSSSPAVINVQIFCELCDCHVGGIVNIEQHIGGKRHQNSIAMALELLQQQLGDGEMCEVSEVFQIDTRQWKEVGRKLRTAVRKIPFSYCCPLCSYEAADVNAAITHMTSKRHEENVKKNPKAERHLILEKTG